MDEHVPLRQSGPADARALGRPDRRRRRRASSSSATPISTASTRPGQQLPYIDRVIVGIADGKLIAGQDRRRRGRPAGARPALRRLHVPARRARSAAATTAAVATRRAARSSRCYPNLNANDPVWRDADPRRALPPRAVARRSTGTMINQVLLFGLASRAQQHGAAGEPAVRAGVPHGAGPSLRPRARPTALLDEIGLTKRDADGIRLLPDGRPLEIVVETAGEGTEEIDVLELVTRRSGARSASSCSSKPSQREIFRKRVVLRADRDVASGTGSTTRMPTADMSRRASSRPSSQEQLHWPKWGQYVRDAAARPARQPPTCPRPSELLALYEAWRQAPDSAERARDLEARCWRSTPSSSSPSAPCRGDPAAGRRAARALRNVPDEGALHLGARAPTSASTAPTRSGSTPPRPLRRATPR